MYIVVTNPIFDIEDLVSFERKSQAMSIDQAYKEADFVNWNWGKYNGDAWIMNLETGEWIRHEWDGDFYEFADKW